MAKLDNELVGRQVVDFKNDKGERISGIKLHFLCDDDRVSGRMCATQFISESHALYGKAQSMPLGAFSFVYGMRGKVVDIVLPEGK